MNSKFDVEELNLVYQIVLQIHTMGTDEALKAFQSALKSSIKSAVKMAEMDPRVAQDTQKKFFTFLLARSGHVNPNTSEPGFIKDDVKLGAPRNGLQDETVVEAKQRLPPVPSTRNPKLESQMINLLKLFNNKKWTTPQMELALARQASYEQFVRRAKSSLLINGALTCLFNPQDLLNGEIWKIGGTVLAGATQSVVTDYAGDLIKNNLPYGDYVAPGAAVAVQTAIDSYTAVTNTGDWARVGKNLGSHSLSTSAGLGCVAAVNFFAGATTGGWGLLAANLVAGTTCRGFTSFGLSQTNIFGGMTTQERFSFVKSMCKESGMSLNDKYTKWEHLEEDMKLGKVEFKPDTSLFHSPGNLCKLAPKELIDSIVADASSQAFFTTRKAGLQHILHSLVNKNDE